MPRAGANFTERMKFGRTRRAEEAVPRVGTKAHDAGESAFEGAETDGAQKRGQIGAEREDCGAIFVTGIDRDDEKNCGTCERRGNGLRDDNVGCRCSSAHGVRGH